MGDTGEAHSESESANMTRGFLSVTFCSEIWRLGFFFEAMNEVVRPAAARAVPAAGVALLGDETFAAFAVSIGGGGFILLYCCNGGGGCFCGIGLLMKLDGL